MSFYIMSSFISSIGQNIPKKLNEKCHIELGWNDKSISDLIVQFFFQLVRTDNTSSLEEKLDMMLKKMKNNEFQYMKYFSRLYKLTGQTRDIISGKGEQQLAFMQIWVWYQHYPKMAEFAFLQMVILNEDENMHPYGSWKDIKYFCKYVKERCNSQNHPLIDFALNISKNKLEREIDIYKKYEKDMAHWNLERDGSEPIKPNLSLISRWIPREKSSFGWVFKKLAMKMNPQFIKTAVTSSARQKAKIKTYITLKKSLVILNKLIDTPQIKMCDKKGRWAELNFNNVTTQTLRRNRRSIMNLNKNNTERSTKLDRIGCASNYEMHKAAAKSDPANFKIHGKRANVYEFVKDAIELDRSISILSDIDNKKAEDSQIDSINMQWNSNKNNNKGLENIPIISMVDTSASMETNNCIPLYNAVGLGIRTSEVTHPAFRNRVLTFSNIPQWINLDDIADNFVKKVIRIKDNNQWAMNTNFYRALKMILDTIVENEIPPKDIEKMVLAIYSDMAIDPSWANYDSDNTSEYVQNENNDLMNTMFDNIEKMYHEAGMRSKFCQPYIPPHVLFWNLRKTDGFPSKITQKNVTFMSGYNSVLLNNFCNKGMESLYEYNPLTMLDNMLDNPRFRSLEIYALASFA
jgi:hypothetical protein